MYKLIALFFCIAVLSTGCKKNNEQMTPKLFELKVKEASQRATKLMQAKQLRSGKVGEAMTAQQTAATMTEAEATQIVQPLIGPSVDFLQSNYDINIYDYFPAGSPKIAQIGVLALRLNQLEVQGKSLDTANADFWFMPQIEVEAQANGEILGNMPQQISLADCALDALGIPAALIAGSAKYITRADIIKAAIKLLSRTMTMMGVALTIYDFGDCMGWW